LLCVLFYDLCTFCFFLILFFAFLWFSHFVFRFCKRSKNITEICALEKLLSQLIQRQAQAQAQAQAAAASSSSASAAAPTTPAPTQLRAAPASASASSGGSAGSAASPCACASESRLKQVQRELRALLETLTMRMQSKEVCGVGLNVM
jgi:hypothetical protein